MPQYRYSALTHTGALVKGAGAAASAQDLQAELAQRGLHVQAIRPVRNRLRPWARRAVPAQALLLLVQELVSLTRAGLPLSEVLALAADRPDQPVLAQVMGRVLADVRAGQLLSQACAAHPDAFDGLFLAALRTGEKTGEFSAVLSRYQDLLRRQVAMQKKVSQALAYPSFLLVALLVILGVMFAFVMPRFVAMYANFDAQLPLPTRWLLAAVEHALPIALLAAAVTVLALWGWRRLAAQAAGRLRIDRWKLRLPLLASATRTAAQAQLARSLATLLAGGTPLVEALRTVHESFPNRAYAAALVDVTARVTQGESLARAMRASGLLPETALKMLQIGEASGSLDRMLAEMALYYEEALEARLARLMALIEPALVLLMGLMIGGIIIVMYLPIFNLAEVIR
ncbi:MAG: type II secretion system F family protein [Hylemonella sp.]|nr:type II secretion system F family protein [Hylemonella sp.]